LKFSIISAVFNNDRTLEQTINSVLSQENVDLEYILIDGKSSDNTLNILEKYKKQIKYLSETDSGIYDAINKGINIASGDIIGIIGADDFYPNRTTLQLVAQAFEKYSTDAIYGSKQYVSPENDKLIVRYWKSEEYSRDKWLYGFMPPHLSFYLKRDAYLKYGVYRTDLTISGDYELMLRMLYKNNLSCHYIPDCLISMRNGGVSTASLKNRLLANIQDRKAWKINHIQPRWFTLYLKPARKIFQFIFKLP